MDHAALFDLRETYNQERILLCFNGPFSQGLIEEIGNALKRYLQAEANSTSAALDVFAVYIEISQNIRNYAALQGYNESDSSATVIISRNDDGRYMVSAGNVVEAADGEALLARIGSLSGLDKAQLRAAYKEQLRKPREDESAPGAGLGLIDMARKASAPLSGALQELPDSNRRLFSLSVMI